MTGNTLHLWAECDPSLGSDVFHTAVKGTLDQGCSEPPPVTENHSDVMDSCLLPRNWRCFLPAESTAQAGFSLPAVVWRMAKWSPFCSSPNPQSHPNDSRPHKHCPSPSTKPGSSRSPHRSRRAKETIVLLPGPGVGQEQYREASGKWQQNLHGLKFGDFLIQSKV